MVCSDDFLTHDWRVHCTSQLHLTHLQRYSAGCVVHGSITILRKEARWIEWNSVKWNLQARMNEKINEINLYHWNLDWSYIITNAKVTYKISCCTAWSSEGQWRLFEQFCVNSLFSVYTDCTTSTVLSLQLFKNIACDKTSHVILFYFFERNFLRSYAIGVITPVTFF